MTISAVHLIVSHSAVIISSSRVNHTCSIVPRQMPCSIQVNTWRRVLLLFTTVISCVPTGYEQQAWLKKSMRASGTFVLQSSAQLLTQLMPHSIKEKHLWQPSRSMQHYIPS